MPRSGYTSITVPIRLKDRLKSASSELGFPSVPNMLESWIMERTGTVQAPNRLSSQAPMTRGPVSDFSPSAELSQSIKHRSWCGRRDSDPGRLRGRQKSYQAGPRPPASPIRHCGILICYLEQPGHRRDTACPLEVKIY